MSPSSKKYIQQYTKYDSKGSFVTQSMDDWGHYTKYAYNSTKGTLSSVEGPTGGVTKYTYNANNDRLEKVTSHDSASGSATTTVRYAYSSRGDLSGITTPSTAYTFTYDAFGNPLKTTAGGRTLVTNTYQDNNGNLASAQYGNGLTVNYGYDSMDRLSSKSYGSVKKGEWVYNAAGYTVGDKNPFRYRGYYYDTETGLYYLNSRYYNPEFGRFISADTPDVITVSPDSAFWDKNLFAYCDGNPVTRVDDCGEFWHFIAGAAVGGLISGISTAISGGSARDIVISAVGGALSGALSASGVGLVGQILGNAAISASSNIATQISDYYSGRRQTFNEKELVADTVWGGVSGVVSGAGATKEFGKKHMVNLGKQTLNKTTDAFVKHGAKAYLKEARIQTNFYVKSTISITKSMFNIKTALTTGANFARAFLNR